MKDAMVGFVKVTCPNCGRERELLVDAEDLRKLEIVNCIVEEGGCDEDFVVRPWAEIKAEVYTISKVKEAAEL